MLYATALASSATPQFPPAITFRTPPETSDGPPAGPAALRVSIRRHGVTMYRPFPCLTVTVKEQFELLPSASVAVEFTVVLPSGNVDPEGGVVTTFAVLQKSVAVTEYVAVAVLDPNGAMTSM